MLLSMGPGAFEAEEKFRNPFGAMFLWEATIKYNDKMEEHGAKDPIKRHLTCVINSNLRSDNNSK